LVDFSCEITTKTACQWTHGFSLELEVNEYPPKILVILLQAVIKLLNMSLIQESQHFLLELAAALARNDLDQLYLPVHGLLDNAIKLRIDLIAAVVDVMQIQFKFCHACALDICNQKVIVATEN
jgi:hypothetical protein